MQRKKYSQKAGRIVRKRLADGTKVEYHYGAWSSKPAQRHAPDTIGALSVEWRASPEWAAYRDATRTHYLIYLRELEALAALPLAEIKRRDILAIRDAIATTRGNGAGNSFIQTAGAAFAWALSRGWIDVTPCHKIAPLTIGALTAWTEAQYAYARDNLPEPLRRAVILAVHTAQRRGDLCALGWNAFDGATIRLTQQKTGVSLVLPVHPELGVELLEWRMSATSTKILTDHRGVPWNPVLLTQKMAYQLQRIGLPVGLGIHGLRKLAATRLAMAECTPHQIGSFTGQKTLAMVQHYTASADQERLAVAAMVRLRTKETG